LEIRVLAQLKIIKGSQGERRRHTHKQGVNESFESGEGPSLCRSGKRGNIVARRILVGRTNKVEAESFFGGLYNLQ
jgi:hypothetical protein